MNIPISDMLLAADYYNVNDNPRIIDMNYRSMTFRYFKGGKNNFSLKLKKQHIIRRMLDSFGLVGDFELLEIPSEIIRNEIINISSDRHDLNHWIRFKKMLIKSYNTGNIEEVNYFTNNRGGVFIWNKNYEVCFHEFSWLSFIERTMQVFLNM